MWVDLSQDGNIVGMLFSTQQSPSQVELSDTDQRVLAFKAQTLFALNQPLGDLAQYLPLVQYKLVKIASIQAHTQQLLTQGFVWNAQTFPISDQIIARWEGLLLKAQGNRVNYPYAVPTLQLKKVKLQNQNDLTALYLAAEARYEALISTNDGSGGEGDLICQIMAAADKAGVDAVTDNRS